MKKSDFIINGKVIYNRAKGTVHNIADEETVFTLQNPANQCLGILIEKQPEIVNQDYFFYHVWEKNGLPVNVNTFYQSISLIRKALKSAGIDEDIIKTTPRLGISIPEYVDITTISDDENASSSSVENSNAIIDRNSENNPQITAINNNIKNSAVISDKHKYIFSLLILLFSAVIIYITKSNLDQGASFSEYSHYGKYKNCQIYTSNRLSSISHIAEVADKLGIHCEIDSTLYYSTTRGMRIDSIFHCGKSTCVSYYYVDGRRQIYEKN